MQDVLSDYINTMKQIVYKVAQFEGPLDLLLHLITKNKFDIYDIKISEIFDQYMEQINKMKDLNMDVSSEFLEMAARLVYMKTISLLPKHEELQELKKELEGQLIEYQECKKIAILMSENFSFDIITKEPEEIKLDMTYTNQHFLRELFCAYINATSRKKIVKFEPTKESFSEIVSKRIISVTSKVVFVLRKLWKNQEVDYNYLFENNKSKSDNIALFLAILELTKSKRINLYEDDNKNLKLKLIKRGELNSDT